MLDTVRDVIYADDMDLALHLYRFMVECVRLGMKEDTPAKERLESHISKEVPLWVAAYTDFNAEEASRLKDWNAYPEKYLKILHREGLIDSSKFIRSRNAGDRMVFKLKSIRDTNISDMFNDLMSISFYPDKMLIHLGEGSSAFLVRYDCNRERCLYKGLFANSRRNEIVSDYLSDLLDAPELSNT